MPHCYFLPPISLGIILSALSLAELVTRCGFGKLEKVEAWIGHKWRIWAKPTRARWPGNIYGLAPQQIIAFLTQDSIWFLWTVCFYCTTEIMIIARATLDTRQIVDLMSPQGVQ